MKAHLSSSGQDTTQASRVGDIIWLLSPPRACLGQIRSMRLRPRSRLPSLSFLATSAHGRPGDGRTCTLSAPMCSFVLIRPARVVLRRWAMGVPPLTLACRSKVQESVEQIEFDLGMLDESIER